MNTKRYTHRNVRRRGYNSNLDPKLRGRQQGVPAQGGCSERERLWVSRSQKTRTIDKYGYPLVLVHCVGVGSLVPAFIQISRPPSLVERKIVQVEPLCRLYLPRIFPPSPPPKI